MHTVFCTPNCAQLNVQTKLCTLTVQTKLCTLKKDIEEKDQRTKGQKDKGTNGQMDKITKGLMGKRANVLEDNRNKTRGPYLGQVICGFGLGWS